MKRKLVGQALNAAHVLLTRRLVIEYDGIPFEFQQVPMKKLLNWLLVESSVYPRPARPWGLPTHLQVEPSSVCNLQCAFCPVTTGMDRPTGLMAFETFRKAFDDLAECLFLLVLWDWGEPFLNPAIYDMIAHAKQWDVRVISSTNGLVFAHSDQAERLVRSGIDSIIFAVDGINQETYEKFRRGGRLETVLTGFERVVAAKRALGSPTPLIHFRFLATRHNEHEIPQLEALARSLGADVLSIKTLNPYDQGECHSTKADGLEFIPTDPRYQRFEYDVETGARIRVERNACKRMWNNPLVAWDGKVSPCVLDPHGTYVCGDLAQQSFWDVWCGSRIRQLRRQFRTDDQKLGLCAGCTYAYEGGEMGTETIAEVHFFKGAEASHAEA
jgi:MoaA/NifB/PqqE/SkfB family radical SAM enzyme